MTDHCIVMTDTKLAVELINAQRVGWVEEDHRICPSLTDGLKAFERDRAQIQQRSVLREPRVRTFW